MIAENIKEMEELKIAIDITQKVLDSVNSEEEYILYLTDKIALVKRYLDLEEKRLLLIQEVQNAKIN